MSTRTERRKVINRKDIDYTCPVDREVVNLLHEYAIEYNATFDEEGILDGSQLSIETVKLIRKDILKQMPGILDGDNTVISGDVEVIDAEVVNETGGNDEGLQAQ